MEDRAVAEGKKNARRRSAWIVFLDESGVSLTPPLRRTWAPRGKTPVIRGRHSNWKRVSMAGLLAFAPDRRTAKVLFHTHSGSYTDETLMAVLGALRRHLRAKATLLWDGLPGHKSRAMEAFVRSQRHWLVVEQLPGYAPDLNPVEGLWSSLKGRELANLCAETIAECVEAARAGIGRVRRDQDLAFAFLRHTGLSL